MRVCLLFDAPAWENRAARWAIETVAPLLDLAWRSAPPGTAAGEGEAVVFVGAPAGAPRDAAAVVAAGEWKPWDAAGLALARFESVPMPCPGGTLAAPGDPRELPEAWLRAIGWMLAREEERASSRRDQWECFAGTFSRLHELGVLELPLVNSYAAQLSRRIAAWCVRRGVRLEPAPRWKNGARFAAALTHDVDDVQMYSLRLAARLLRLARGPRSYAFRKGVATALRSLARLGRAGDPYWNFDRWVAEESRRGFRSGFYFFAPDPQPRHEYDAQYTMSDALEFEGRRTTVAGLVRALAGRGFEIGLHGSYGSHLDASALAREKRQIEQVAGGPIAGVRQHFLRFEAARTWSAQQEAGFTCDSTLGYNEAIGFRAGIAAPFHPWDAGREGPMELLELPLTAMDGALFRAMKLDPAAAIVKAREHLDRVEAAGGLAVLLWHPNAADEQHFPGWWPCYIAALDHLVARGAWVATPTEIAAWWRERTARLAGGTA
ncbi:MAG TPA: polysaccharide deacetylase family protein [Candidatus Eisenbacteria bacterium]|jgi:peptidoglycan/xylan/chitin deacetylase (PgdA/CDA1 family)